MIKIPEYVKNILDTLNEHNYAAYVVGGCVRDSLLGIEPHDWDITTDATPDQVEQLFDRSYETGKRFGTITVGWVDDIVGEEYLCELTTFRSDGVYEDGRRPDTVTFGKSIYDDLARRDFTINAIAYNELVGLVDPYYGENDVVNGILRCVGDPETRFNEDALRILRGIRFACKYGLTIDNDTYLAMNKCSENVIKNVSKERIHDELIKIFTYAEYSDDTIDKFQKLWELLFRTKETSSIKSKISDDICNNLSINQKIYSIFRSWNLVDIEIWLREYKFSNKDIKQILNFSKIQQYIAYELNSKGTFELNDVLIRTLLSKYPYEDIIEYSNLLPILRIDDIERNNKLPHLISDLAINGNDLVKVGFKGEEIGRVLELLLNEIIVNPEYNTKVTLTAMAISLYNGTFNKGENKC